ncbi:MAG: DNA-binding domain-containing protein [Rudaea sp.]
MTTTHLASLQADFAAALNDARFAPAIAPAWSGGDNAIERLALYRGNLFAGWLKALSDAFPVTRAIVDDSFFSSLAREYGHAHPSTSGDLNLFGETFPDFVRRHERTQSLPYLSDMAELEWLVHRAYFAKDMMALSPSALVLLSPRDLLARRFSVHPAFAWVSSEFPIASIWAAHQAHASAELPRSLDPNEHALVYRSNWRAGVSISSAGEIAALKQLRNGENMETAIRCALNIDPDYRAENALSRWLDLCLLGDAD